MAEDQGKKRYRDPYKIVLMKAETLEEVGSYRLTPLNVYILVSSILVIMALIVVALIFFTPLKRLAPGYADITENKAYMTLSNEIDELEELVDAQQAYIERFRAIVTGDSTGQMPLEALARVRDTGLTYRTPEQEFEGLDYLYVVPPLSGEVSRGFDAEEGHIGIDLLAPLNTPVKAILPGYVIASDWTLETGNTIGIQHEGRLVSFYKHNARNLKKLGSYVEAGEAIAIIGNTGELSTGPHLHFELWLDGKPVDPARFINFE